MALRLEGMLSLGEHTVLAEGARVTVENAVVKNASGKVIGRVVSGRVEDGQVYVIMEIGETGSALLASAGPMRLG